MAPESALEVNGVEATIIRTASGLAGLFVREHRVKYLWLMNSTGDEIHIGLGYRTQTPEGHWEWRPGDPDRSSRCIWRVLQPHEGAFVWDNNLKVAASRVRVWALSRDAVYNVEGGSIWRDDRFYKKDLWLLSSPYRSPFIKTFHHCIVGPGQHAAEGWEIAVKRLKSGII